jgi:DNA-directed RNA polymerase specialized sigma24 family protein
MPEIKDNPTVSDELLVKGLLKEEKAALLLLMARIDHIIRLLLRKYFSHLLKNGLDIQKDISQDLYLVISKDHWKKLADFRYDAKLTTWLRSVIFKVIKKKYNTRTSLGRTKYQQPLNELLLSVADPSFDITKKLDTEKLKVKILRIVTEWNNDLDRKIMIGILNHYSDGEIADKYNIPLDHVYMRKHRMKAGIKAQLKSNNHEH